MLSISLAPNTNQVYLSYIATADMGGVNQQSPETIAFILLCLSVRVEDYVNKDEENPRTKYYLLARDSRV